MILHHDKNRSRSKMFYSPWLVVSLWTVVRLSAWKATEELGVPCRRQMLFIKEQNKQIRKKYKRHPKSHLPDSTYSSQVTPVYSDDMKEISSQTCLVLLLPSPNTCTDTHTHTRAHTSSVCVTRSCLDVGWLSLRCKSVADPYWPRAHSLIYFLLSWL